MFCRSLSCCFAASCVLYQSGLPPTGSSVHTSSSSSSSSSTKPRRAGGDNTVYVVNQRRKWEQRLAGVLAEKKENVAEIRAKRFNDVYVHKNFTPVESAFPLSDRARWAGLQPSSSLREIASQPPDAHVVKVAVVGPPNAGKSMLVNALTTSHVSATSFKEGTTKDWVKAVATLHSTQLVFLDTPGIFHLQKPSDRKRYEWHTFVAYDALFSADIVLLVFPVGLGFVDAETRAVMAEVCKRSQQRELPVVLAFSKMDKLTTPQRKELFAELRSDMDSLGLPLTQQFEVSASQFKGIVELKDFLARYGKPRNWEFHRHEASDMNDAERASEVLREVFFAHLPHRIPHLMRHKIAGWTTQEDGSVAIHVEVFFDRPTFLKVFYGKVEVLGDAATAEIQKVLKKKCRVWFQPFVAPGAIKRG